MAFLAVAALLLLAGCAEEASVITPTTPSLPDFSAIRKGSERKLAFFAYLRPLVTEENERILGQRRRLLRHFEEHRGKPVISQADINWLEDLLEEYGVDRMASGDTSLWETLLRRVDIIPLDLAMVQAAKESGWGTSRFAREGNNLYGQRCFTAGCGIVPAGRAEGATHEVRRFDSAADSVQSYIYNLNTNNAYRRFRLMRRLQRLEGKKPDGFSLAESLPRYSERRYRYLDEIREMMKINRHYLAS